VREHHGVKAYRKYRGKAPHILDLKPIRRYVSFIAFPYPLDRNLGGPNRKCESVGRRG
jgi:hypothetical protein